MKSVFGLERATGRRVSWLSVIGVLLVPMLIAGGFLAATWNSSSRWDKVQAAIVNNDQGTKINGQLVPLGRELSGGLVDGGNAKDADKVNNFDWVITDAADAASGLANGQYAAVVTIPRTFSKDATSYSANKGSKARQATLDVATSKVSGVTDAAIAQAISSTAVQALNTTLTKQYLGNLYLGFNQTAAGMQSSADGASKLADGSAQLSDGIGQSAVGSQKLTDGLRQLGTGTRQLASGLHQTDSGAGQLATGVAGLAKGIQQTDTGVGKLDQGVGQLDASTGKFVKGVQQTADGVGSYTSGVKTYVTGVSQYADGVQTYAKRANAYINGTSQIAAGFGSYVNGVDQFVRDGVPATANAVRGQVTSPGSLSQACVAAKLTDPRLCHVFQAGMKAGAKTTAAGIKQGIRAGWSTEHNGASLRSSSKQLKKAAAGLSSPELAKLTAGGTQIIKSSKQLSGKTANQLIKGGDQLSSGADQLAQGAKQLGTGISSLHTGVDQLATGTGKLASGANKLSSGAAQLAAGTGQLADAGDKLATGTQQSATGSQQLTTGLTKLQTGSTGLAKGTKSLAGGLQKAADQLPSYTDHDRTQLSKVASAPVDTSQPSSLFSNVVTTTLLMALALWIGGLATYLVVGAVPQDTFGSSKSSVRLALQGMAPGVVIGAIQAVALSIMLAALLDLSAGRFLGLLGFGLLAAVAFAVLNHALVAWFGGIGRFISLAVVVFAAAASLTNALPAGFATIRPWLPITPGLDGIRAIATGSSAGSQLGVLLIWLVIGAVAGLLAVARRRMASAAA